MSATLEDLRALIRDVPDFPKPGVVFKDLTPLWADAPALRRCVDLIADHFADVAPTTVLGIEARGFILAAPVAYRLGAGFVPARKKGKLPWTTSEEAYDLEYGTEQLEVHSDAAAPGERVLIVDDVLATGGTARAAGRLVERLGATVAGIGVLVELEFLAGRSKLPAWDVMSLLAY